MVEQAALLQLPKVNEISGSAAVASSYGATTLDKASTTAVAGGWAPTSTTPAGDALEATAQPTPSGSNATASYIEPTAPAAFASVDDPAELAARFAGRVILRALGDYGAAPTVAAALPVAGVKPFAATSDASAGSLTAEPGSVSALPAPVPPVAQASASTEPHPTAALPKPVKAAEAPKLSPTVPKPLEPLLPAPVAAQPKLETPEAERAELKAVAAIKAAAKGAHAPAKARAALKKATKAHVGTVALVESLPAPQALQLVFEHQRLGDALIERTERTERFDICRRRAAGAQLLHSGKDVKAGAVEAKPLGDHLPVGAKPAVAPTAVANETQVAQGKEAAPAAELKVTKEPKLGKEKAAVVSPLKKTSPKAVLKKAAPTKAVSKEVPSQEASVKTGTPKSALPKDDSPKIVAKRDAAAPAKAVPLETALVAAEPKPKASAAATPVQVHSPRPPHELPLQLVGVATRKKLKDLEAEEARTRGAVEREHLGGAARIRRELAAEREASARSSAKSSAQTSSLTAAILDDDLNEGKECGCVASCSCIPVHVSKKKKKPSPKKTKKASVAAVAVPDPNLSAAARTAALLGNRVRRVFGGR
jgi:hypothetical protein